MARRFLHGTAERLNLPPCSLSAADERWLLAYDFPGNVRELQNIIERMVVLRREEVDGPCSEPPPDVAPGGADAGTDDGVLTLAELRALEQRNFIKALEQSSYQIAGPRGAARRLGMSPSTLSYRLKQLGIERPK
jgi:transcriptional regulator with GAF, ATPase, and Fis domain